jgi:hypothetical protein
MTKGWIIKGYYVTVTENNHNRSKIPMSFSFDIGLCVNCILFSIY